MFTSALTFGQLKENDNLLMELSDSGLMKTPLLSGSIMKMKFHRQNQGHSVLEQ